MDLLMSFGLILVLLFAFCKLAGGSFSSILNPVIKLATGLVNSFISFVFGILSHIGKVGAENVKAPKLSKGGRNEKLGKRGPAGPQSKDDE